MPDDEIFYAHSLADSPSTDWQPLDDHLTAVAQLATDFAEPFGGKEAAYLCGLWHDLGKYQPAFQRRLAGEAVRVEHSGAGAALTFAHDRTLGLALAFAIVGHHGGMPNAIQSGSELPTPLKERLRANEAVLAGIQASVPPAIVNHPFPLIPSFLKVGPGTSQHETRTAKARAEFWIRFLFSALVDADWLDTERFLDPRRFEVRGRFDSIEALQERLDAHIDQKVAALTAEGCHATVNQARASVLEACRRTAAQEPGLFALTVPTGGGKTLSAMSFALRHAKRHGKRRVIVVIPYTSIIEQNAAVYREALGPENVLEHHANLDPARQLTELGENVTRRHKLAAENWDAPVIVTTTVQFFESLFSNKPSRCRKLHNIADSVVILDEVQTLPPDFLHPILDGLNQLVDHYGCSVVLSTATPPALAYRDRFEMGLRGVRPIVPDPRSLAADLKRVDYKWPSLEEPAVEWPELAGRIAQEPRVLAVVHRRQDARVLAEQVRDLTPGEPLFHLSALMCPAHRLDVLSDIHTALAKDGPCRVVSTQLVEAGVDLDFPVVFRALGGLDSIVQAAGRCNREGREQTGRVDVFRAASSPPPGTLRQALETTVVMLNANGGSVDPTDPATIEEYFRRLYAVSVHDQRNIQGNRQEFNFATVARDFRLIEDGFTKSIIVPYGQGEERLAKRPFAGPNREWFRSLQPYTVSIYEHAFQELEAAGAVMEIADGVFSLTLPFKHLYDPIFGLVTGDTPQANPEGLIA